MELRRIFGANLRHHRKARVLTQEALAEKADLSVEMIGRIERGEVAPSFDTIENLAKTLDLPVLAFFGSGAVIAPDGKRGHLLLRINGALSKLNENHLDRVTRMLEAYVGK